MLLRSSGRIVATDTHELTMENTAGSCWGAVSVRESIISDIRPVWLDFFFPPLVIGRSGSNYCGVFAQWASREMQEATSGSRADDEGWEKFVTSKDQSTRVHMTLMVTQHVNIQGLFFFLLRLWNERPAGRCSWLCNLVVFWKAKLMLLVLSGN